MSKREEIIQEVKKKEKEIEDLKKQLQAVPDVRKDFTTAKDKFCLYCRKPIYIVSSKNKTYTCLNEDCRVLGLVVVIWTITPPEPEPESRIFA